MEWFGLGHVNAPRAAGGVGRIDRISVAFVAGLGDQPSHCLIQQFEWWFFGKANADRSAFGALGLKSTKIGRVSARQSSHGDRVIGGTQDLQAGRSNQDAQSTRGTSHQRAKQLRTDWQWLSAGNTATGLSAGQFEWRQWIGCFQQLSVGVAAMFGPFVLR